MSKGRAEDKEVEIRIHGRLVRQRLDYRLEAELWLVEAKAK
jgi:hypothetical protein